MELKAVESRNKIWIYPCWKAALKDYSYQLKIAIWDGGQSHLAQEFLLLRARCSRLEGLGSCSGSIQGKAVVEILQGHSIDTLQKTVVSPSAPAVILWEKYKAASAEGIFKTCSTAVPCSLQLCTPDGWPRKYGRDLTGIGKSCSWSGPSV